VLLDFGDAVRHPREIPRHGLLRKQMGWVKARDEAEDFAEVVAAEVEAVQVEDGVGAVVAHRGSLAAPAAVPVASAVASAA
jgi:hypothetical protein